MSVQAMAWAISGSHGAPTHLRTTLIGLANHADQYGDGAWPSIPTLAEYTGKSQRSVQTDLRRLEALGLIRRGDQRRVAHLDPRYRPVVYNLALERGEAHFTPNDPGVKSSASRGEVQRHPGVKPTSPKPSLNRPRTSGADLEGNERCDECGIWKDGQDDRTWDGHLRRCGS